MLLTSQSPGNAIARAMEAPVLLADCAARRDGVCGDQSVHPSGREATPPCYVDVLNASCAALVG
jgi:hypothetical protein